MRIRAYAKINLTLDVLNRRPDGYHTVDMLLQSVSLCDDLTLREDDDLRLFVDGDAPADESNLVLRAARLLQAHTGTRKGAYMELRKRIPTAAGLGGGSADAAAALAGLNRLWGLSLPMEQLEALGARLGADVPFCLTGGSARARGIGTELSPVPVMPDAWIVLCKPCAGMLTKDVYGALDLPAFTQTDHPDTPGAIRALEAGDLLGLCSALGNVLETVTLKSRPEAAAAMRILAEEGALAARMSGSGPTIYGIYSEEAMACVAMDRLPDDVWKTLVWPCDPQKMMV